MIATASLFAKPASPFGLETWLDDTWVLDYGKWVKGFNRFQAEIMQTSQVILHSGSPTSARNAGSSRGIGSP